VKQYTHTSVVLLILLGLMLALGLTACRSNTGQTDEGAVSSGDTSATGATPTATALAGGPATEDPTATPAAMATPEPTAAPTEAAAPESGATTDKSAEAETSMPRTFQIVQEKSEARFLIDEILLGNPNTVIGTTSQVSGEVIVNPADPTQAQISPIQVNARDLTTDDNRRNGAIRRFILQSNQDKYQFIVFQPTVIEGLPDSVPIGEPFEFRVTGDLKIRDITNPVTFDMTVTANSENELSGSGATTVLRSDYGLNIPSVPSVADVSEEVRLEVDFIAAAVEAESSR
jgi:polyisoprenoid-binding protein YceI